jgi:hypothetical protein
LLRADTLLTTLLALVLLSFSNSAFRSLALALTSSTQLRWFLIGVKP